jgi:hypothetical protein
MPKPHKTPLHASEGDNRGLELGRRQGAAYGQTLLHMLTKVADCGEEIESGDYLIAFAAEAAEGLYVLQGGKLFWREPAKQNVHIEVAVRDRADGRLIPSLRVRVSVSEKGGREIGTHIHPLLWHPYLYHYGRNWHIRGSGTYSIRVQFDAPAFPRHDIRNGRRLNQGADVTFRDVTLTTPTD